jgi:hypothetical protein
MLRAECPYSCADVRDHLSDSRILARHGGTTDARIHINGYDRKGTRNPGIELQVRAHGFRFGRLLVLLN